VILSAAATGLLLLNYRRGDPSALAMLLIIVLLSVRGAWKNDQQIRQCDRTARNSARNKPADVR